MADKTVTTTTTVPPKRHRFLRSLVWICGIVIILLVVVYFVATSSAFLKGAILPRVSKSINADVTVSDASISPFKEVVLHNLKVQAAGQTPLLTTPEVRLHYSLMDIIKGHINVDEILVASPVISVVENPDGTKNYDAIVNSQKSTAGKKAEPEKQASAKSSQPPQVFLKKISVTDGSLHYTKNYSDKNHDSSDITHFNFSVDNVKNGDTAKISIGGDASVENNPPSPGTNGSLQAKVTGDFALALGADLKPGSISGGTRMEVSKAGGAMADLATLIADFKCDVSPTEIKQVALKFSKGSSQLGQVLASGPFDMSKMEGKIGIQVLSIDKQVLNLAGAKSGLDFGSTVLNSTNQIELSREGKLITAAGNVTIGKLQVTQAGKQTPTLDLLAAYDVTVDTVASSAVLRKLSIDGKQNGGDIIKSELSSPMTLTWGNAQSQVGDSTLTLAINNLNLADWKAFANDAVSSGSVNSQVKLVSQQSGKLLNFTVDTRLSDLTFKAGTNQISQASITLQADGRANDMSNLKLNTYTLQISHQNQQLLQVSGSGTYDTKAQNADIQASVQSSIPALLTLSPQPDTKFTSGTVEMKVHVVQRADTSTGKTASPVLAVTGDLTLSDLTGTMGKNNFQGFATTMTLDIGKTDQEIQIRRVNGSLSEGGKPGGSFDLNGTYNTNKNAQLTAKLSDFNQNGLRPFLEPMLTDKKLTSVAINGTSTIQYNPEGSSAIKANVTVTNLVVADAKNQMPATPLQATIAMDVALNKTVADLHQLSLTLTPTDRAKNEINLTGHLDMTQTNATQGNLKLASEGLDVTRYYDIFAGNTNADAKKTTAKASQPASSSETRSATTASNEPEKEPDPKQLPFKNFTTVVDIKKFYLREMEIMNLQATAAIDGGHVVLKPFQLALNGAPVTATADIDLTVPGYKYDTTFGMQAVPLTPLVNSFAPERKGQIGGTMTAQANLAGTGTTGASLQKNLNGKFDVTSTNLNLSIVNIKSRMLKSLINVVGSVPELIHNPTAGAISVLQGATGIGGGGLTEDLKKSPIDSIAVHGAAGSGKVDLQQAMVSSSAFKADAKGTVTIASILTNSPIQIPVTISLSRALAQKVNMVSSDTPTNAAYAALPSFYTMKGTVGNPKNDIDKVALLKLTASALTGNVNLGGTAGNVLQGLGLGGKSSGQNTNASPSTSKSTDVLKGLGGLLNSGSSNTNSTSTNKNNQAPVNNLLNGLFGPKKK